MIPQTYQEWHYCITQSCKIELTNVFIDQRLAVFTDTNHQETIKFVSLYGRNHLLNIIQWLEKAKNMM